jgi:MerR family transcriptional regulator/heat shock protein HspR
MNVPHDPLVILEEEAERLTQEMLAERTGVHPRRIDCYVEFGLLEPCERTDECLFFRYEAVTRVRAIERLRREVGVNLAGVSVILDLTERLRRMQQEVQRLQSRLLDPET